VQENRKWYRVHLVGEQYYIRDNSSDRSTVVNDAPIFLHRVSAWKWLRETHPGKLVNDVYNIDDKILI